MFSDCGGASTAGSGVAPLTSRDSYTAVILLAYNRWTNDTLQEASLVSFEVAKIVFSVCISLSFVLLAIDWWVAVQVLRSDGVAEAYMNVIAVRINCIRGGPARGDSGWKRFLVFSRLTKSRGIVDYLALLTYFAFKGLSPPLRSPCVPG